MASFFRPAALDHQRQRLHGELSLTRPPSFVGLTALIATFTISVFALLAIGEYPQKETVSGFLEPQRGLVRVHSDQAGVVSELKVSEGQTVMEGDPLIDIEGESYVSEGAPVLDSIIDSINSRRTKLIENQYKLISKHQEELGLIDDRIGLTQVMVQQRNSEITILRRRFSLNESLIERFRELAKTGYQSDLELSRQMDSLLVIEQQIANAEAAISELHERLANLQAEKVIAPLEHHNELTDIEERIEEMNTQILTHEADRSSTLRAPISGTISGLTAYRGSTVDPNQSILTIIPDGAVLNATLLVPSSAIGRIENGQAVRLRYSAFPYQRFGVQRGRIYRIGRTVLFPAEHPHANGMEQPFFRVEVELERQSLSAYGKVFPLRSGMIVEADIIVDNRSLFGWLFDPALSAIRAN